MIVCVSPNPAIEHTWVIPGFSKGGVFRAQAEVVLPSGKGVNAARAIQTLGGNAHCLGFLAGQTGQRLQELAEQAEIPGTWTWVDGETRTSAAIVDPHDHHRDGTLISAAGPTVTGFDWERLSANVLVRARLAHLICFSGSLPPGTPLAEFSDLIQQLQAQANQVWVDGSGPGLQTAVGARASGIKANGIEVGEVLGFPVESPEQAVRAGERLLEAGVQTAVITLGRAGSVLVAAGQRLLSTAPQVACVSSVGSGDAFMGGLLFGIEQQYALKECLRMATAAGTANTQAPGGGRFDLGTYQALLPEIKIFDME